MISRRRKKSKKKFIITVIVIALVLISLVFIGEYYLFIAKNTSMKEGLKTQINDDVVGIPKVTEKDPKETPVEKDPISPIKETPTTSSRTKYTYSRYTISESKATTERIGFWFGRNKTFIRPNGPISIDTFNKYNSFYIGKDEKVVYLTFDEGLNNTQADINLGTLKRHNAEDPLKFIKELAITEETFTNITGKVMNKVFRFPEGTFSERSLDYVNQMGYRSIFWSFAYKDWNADWNTKEQSLEWMKNYYHPGAIYLLHGVSRGNAEALDEFISFLEEKGYKFDVVTNL